MAEFPDLFNCSICLEVYKTPRHLQNCSHVYCTKCIQGLVSNSKLTCPECRTIQRLPNGVEGLPRDIKLCNMMEYFECTDCGKLDQYACPCSNCTVRVCPNCQKLHSNEKKCEIIREVRKLELSQPDTKINEQFQTFLGQWKEYVENNCKLKRQVNEAFENIMKRAKERRFEILTKISEMDKLAERNIEKLEKINSVSQFISDTKTTISADDMDECYEEITEKCRDLQTLVSQIDGLKKSAVAKLVRIEVQDKLEVLRAISEYGLNIDFTYDDEKTEPDEQYEKQLLWSAKTATIKKYMYKHGDYSYYKIGQGYTEVVRLRGNLCEMTLTKNEGSKLKWRWDNESATEPTMDVNRHWLMAPWQFTAVGQTDDYSIQLDSQDAINKFVEKLKPYASKTE